MSEEHVQAGKMDEAEEVFNMVFPSRDKAAEVVHTGEEAFQLPATAISAELSTVLCLGLIR